MPDFDVVVTGAAGFIGAHVTRLLSEQGHRVLAIDSLRPVYDQAYQRQRVNSFSLTTNPNISFHTIDLGSVSVESLSKTIAGIPTVVHLAASPGVRRSTEYPSEYSHNNIRGFVNVLDASTLSGTSTLLFASSSSVYGNRPAGTHMPETLADGTCITSYYAGTKWANEVLARAHPNKSLRTCAMRFFTVYGPWGRPDMAYFSFAKKIMEGSEIQLYGDGVLERDFTHISDLDSRLSTLIDLSSNSDLSLPPALNFGLGKPMAAARLLQLLEENLKRKAIVKYVPKPVADVDGTFSDATQLTSMLGNQAATSFEDGIADFSSWFLRYVKS